MIKLAKSILAIFSPANKRKCFALVLGMFLGGLMEAAGIGFVLPLIRILEDEHYLDKFPLVSQAFTTVGAVTHVDKIILFALFMLGFSLFKCFFMVWINKKGLEFTYDNEGYYGARLLSSYLRKPYLFHVSTSSAVLLRNITQGMSSIFTNVVSEYFHLLVEVLTGVLIWILLFYLDWFTAVVVAGFFGIFLTYSIRLIRKKAQQIGQENAKYSAEYYKWSSQSLHGIKETKIAHKEEFFVEQFSKGYRKFAETNKKRFLLDNLPRSVIEAVVITGLVLLIVVKLLLGSAPDSIVPLLGVLALAAFRLMPCVNRSIISYNGIKFGSYMYWELYPDVLRIARQKQDKDQAVALGKPLSFAKEIVIKDLAFGYTPDKIIWQHVNFTIRHGDFVGIVGASGAGKTTFADTFLGLLPPVAGQILVDGEDALANLYSWQSKMAYVSQNIFLIEGSVCDNVAFGELPEDVDRERVWKALQMAELADFVRQFPDTLDANIGENGVKLSGGQRQRIGIARALYQQPEILVLDEATSALDNATEHAIMVTLGKLKGKITMVAIAHRLSTLDDCDFKVNFDRGTAQVMK